MRVLIQRVTYASVIVERQKIAEIGKGLVLLIGVAPQDNESQTRYLVEKIANLRIFEDDAGKMNRSILDIQGETIVVSQFTLFADTRNGRRPAFVDAAPPDIAAPLVTCFANLLHEKGIPTQTGRFGASMLVKIHNDGPVTMMLER